MQELPLSELAIPRWRKVAAGLALLAIATCLAATLADPASGQTFGPLGVLVGMMTSGALFITGARNLGADEKKAWTLIGVGLFTAGTGVLTIGISETLGHPTPAFGPFDAFFIVAYSFVLVGLGSLPHVAGDWRRRTRVLLDGLVGAISIGALLWYFLLHDLWSLAEGPFFDRLLGSLYPALDSVILVALMIVTVRRGSHRFDVRLVLITIGYVALIAGDFSFFVGGVGKNFSNAEPNFIFYLIAVASYVTAAVNVVRVPPPRESQHARPPWWSMAAPYGLAMFMVGVVTFQVFRADAPSANRIVFGAAIIVGLLVIARQSLAIQENRVLVENERSALVSSISHELRTPLTSMIGFLELLEGDQADLADEERAEFTEIVRDQAHYMGRIIMDLVMLSREEYSHVTLVEETVELGAIARAAVNTLGSSAERVSVDLETGLEVHVDAARVVQVISNLLTNGVRYGGRKVVLRLMKKGSGLLIEVHDDGPGVPKKFQLAIWERFERGAHRFSGAVRGSGIGLAIVTAIVDAHKGTSGYRTSEVLGGACFWVVLPDRVVSSRSTGRRMVSPEPAPRPKLQHS